MPISFGRKFNFVVTFCISPLVPKLSINRNILYYDLHLYSSVALSTEAIHEHFTAL